MFKFSFDVQKTECLLTNGREKAGHDKLREMNQSPSLVPGSIAVGSVVWSKVESGYPLWPCKVNGSPASVADGLAR